jgi:hypothetical protein
MIMSEIIEEWKRGEDIIFRKQSMHSDVNNSPDVNFICFWCGKEQFRKAV